MRILVTGANGYLGQGRLFGEMTVRYKKYYIIRKEIKR